MIIKLFVKIRLWRILQVQDHNVIYMAARILFPNREEGCAGTHFTASIEVHKVDVGSD